MSALAPLPADAPHLPRLPSVPNLPKPISRPLHGVVTDYPYVALVSTAPETAGFADEKTAATLCRVMARTILVSSLLTRAEWGVFKTMPYKTHLFLDRVGGLTARSAPWLFGFAGNERARNTFLAMGVFGGIAGTMSDTAEMPV